MVWNVIARCRYISDVLPIEQTGAQWIVSVKFPTLLKATLIKRYKRFLADVRLEDGRTVTAHCPNSGSMMGCKKPGSPVYLSYRPSPRRKLAYTWEILKVGRCWVGINTGNPNQIIAEAIAEGRIPELEGYGTLKREVPYGNRSRIDILLSEEDRKCYVEVKNVTLAYRGVAYFPDAVTTRGTKHLRELEQVVRQGHRGVMLFLVHRSDGKLFRPADFIDPEYGETLRQASENGVEVLVYGAKVSPRETILTGSVDFDLAAVSKSPLPFDS